MSGATDTRSTRRAAGVVGVAVLASRLFGLVREQVFAAMFGAGRLLDVYLAAFQIPNLLRDLFAEGALSVAFTTLFTRSWEKEGEQAAWRLASLILSAMIFVIGVVCLLGVIAAPLLVELTNHGYHAVPGKFEQTVRMTRVLFPFILFVSLGAAVMGMLNARFIFAVPASASTVFNIVSVISGVMLAFAFEPAARAHWSHPVFGERALLGVSLGVLLGGVAQLGMQLPSLYRLGYRFHWSLNLRDPRLAELWSLMWPSVVAGAAVQVNVLVNGNFASTIDGGRSWLFCAFRLMQFPLGIFGVSLATATLPAVTRARARGDMTAFGDTVRDSLRLAWFLAAPASAGLFALAGPIIGLIYQHGHFSAHDTLQTGRALQAYALGLAGYAAIKVLTPCFFALERPKTPLRVSLIGIGVNLALNLANAYWFGLGHVGLALTTSVVALANYLQLMSALSKSVSVGGVDVWAGFLARTISAAALCGWVAWFAQGRLVGLLPGLFGQVFALGVAVALAVGVYFAAARLMRLEESAQAWAMIRRRLPARR